MFMTVGFEVDMLEKITDTKRAENLFLEGMFRLVKLNIQVSSSFILVLR